MREIKFRAWYEANWINPELGKYGMLEKQWKMGKVHSFHFNKNKAMVSSGAGVISMEIGDKCKIMQYTGLKDKNGREIYEGDVVTDDHNYYLVEFKHGMFKPICYAMLDEKGSATGYEIIGNIYEHSHLLEG